MSDRSDGLSESDKWRIVFRYLTIMNSDLYSSTEKLEILDKTAEFMKQNIDSIKDSKDAFREISRFFVSSVKRQHGENLEDFDDAVRFIERYLNEKDYPVAGTGGSDGSVPFRRYKLDETKKEKHHPLSTIEHICTRFHLVTQQLKNRHNNRSTLEISDEYDVQDLFHVLLRFYFDDIRIEEYTPSYGGGASRMDFLLKEEKIVVEIKKTRDSLGEKELGDQLLIDMERYQKHPDCKTLICFIYDPEGKISNPRGFEKDLTKEIGKISTKVLIVPRGY